jgi:hypothetical protein
MFEFFLILLEQPPQLCHIVEMHITVQTSTSLFADLSAVALEIADS